uniref:C-type lectin domain-containing protein n=1 Tax=Lotharella globosa TaxID=91324 RepID=A0A6V3PQY4_9EUKA
MMIQDSENPNNNAWIGLYFDDMDEEYQWVDGNTVEDFENWGEAQPAGTTGNAAVLRWTNGRWTTANATDGKQFLCSIPITHAPTATRAPSAAPTVTEYCPESGPKNSSSIRGEGSSKLVEYFDVFTPWFEARECCLQRGGDLLVVENDDETALAMMIQDSENPNNNAWIGLSYNDADEEFQWVDGGATDDFENWGEAQPAGTTGNAAVLRWTNGRWTTADETDGKRFLCSIPITHAPTVTRAPSTAPTVSEYCPEEGPKNSSSIRGEGSSKLVEYFDTFSPWFEARQCCRQRGGDLLVVENDEETALAMMIQNQDVASNNAWIGLYYNEEEANGTYEWVDGNGVDAYDMWGETQPAGTTGTAAVLRWTNGRWTTANATDGKQFLCSIPITHSPTATRSPSAAPTEMERCPLDGPKRSNATEDGKVLAEYFEEFYAWEDARACCVQRGGDLFVVADQDDNDLAVGIQDTVSKQNNAWIGLEYSFVNESYLWVDGTTPTNFSQWAANEPANATGTDGGVATLLRWSSGEWVTAEKESLRRFICGISLETVSPTTAPTAAPVYNTSAPSFAPTSAPTSGPVTTAPTSGPQTEAPTTAPTEAPTAAPSSAPASSSPASNPTPAPSSTPVAASSPSSAPVATVTTTSPSSAAATSTTSPSSVATVTTTSPSSVSTVATTSPSSAATTTTTSPSSAPTTAPEDVELEFTAAFEDINMEVIPEGSALQATFIDQFQTAVASVDDTMDKEDVVVTGLESGSVIVTAATRVKDNEAAESFQQAMTVPEAVFTVPNGFNSSLFGVPTVNFASEPPTSLPTSSPTFSGIVDSPTADDASMFYIIGGVVGGVVLLALGVCLCLFLRRKEKKKDHSSAGSSEQQQQHKSSREDNSVAVMVEKNDVVNDGVTDGEAAAARAAAVAAAAALASKHSVASPVTGGVAGTDDVQDSGVSSRDETHEEEKRNYSHQYEEESKHHSSGHSSQSYASGEEDGHEY